MTDDERKHLDRIEARYPGNGPYESDIRFVIALTRRQDAEIERLLEKFSESSPFEALLDSLPPSAGKRRKKQL